MIGVAGTIGERWTYTGAPCPTPAQMWDARRSETQRRVVDLAYAAWLGLPEDEVGPFLAALARFDARTPAWEQP